VQGHTPLQYAAGYSRVAVAQLLLTSGANIEAGGSGGMRPLFRACARGHDDMARLLLRSGADIAAAADDGRTALHVAVRFGHAATAQILLDWAAPDRGRLAQAEGQPGPVAAEACASGALLMAAARCSSAGLHEEGIEDAAAYSAGAAATPAVPGTSPVVGVEATAGKIPVPLDSIITRQPQLQSPMQEALWLLLASSDAAGFTPLHHAAQWGKAAAAQVRCWCRRAVRYFIMRQHAAPSVMESTHWRRTAAGEASMRTDARTRHAMPLCVSGACRCF
jgi:hypothetical protein